MAKKAVQQQDSKQASEIATMVADKIGLPVDKISRIAIDRWSGGAGFTISVHLKVEDDLVMGSPASSSN